MCDVEIEKTTIQDDDFPAMADYSLNRNKVLSITSSIKLIFYQKYLLVNKTDQNIKIRNQVISSRTNQYLFDTSNPKVQL